MVNIDTSPETIFGFVETRVTARVECSMCKKSFVEYGEDVEELKQNVAKKLTTKGWQWAVVSEDHDEYFSSQVVCYDCRCSLGVKL